MQPFPSDRPGFRAEPQAVPAHCTENPSSPLYARLLIPALLCSLVACSHRTILPELDRVPNASTSRPPEVPSPIDFNWKAFGARWRQAHPQTRGDAMATALSVAVAEELARMGVQRNDSAAGRDRARELFGSALIGTCGHLAESLRSATLGAGLSPECSAELIGVKGLRLNGRPDLSDIYNYDHVCNVVFTDGSWKVYDLWLHAVDTGSHRAFRKSPWCGATLMRWQAAMSSRGYASFSVECGDSKRAIDSPAALEPPTPRVDRPL